MGVDLSRIEALLRHQRRRAVGRAPALAADAVDVDVVAHEIRDVDRDRLVRKRGEAQLAAAVEHACRVVDRVRRGGTFEHVVETVSAGETPDRLDRILPAYVDHVVGAELAADLQAVVARAGEDHRSGAQCLGDGDPEQADRAGAQHRHAFAGDEPTQFGEPVHRRAGGDDQCRLLVRHVVRDRDERVDVIDLIFAKAAVGGKAVGAVALVAVAVIEAVVEAGGVHAFAATFALTAAGVDLDRDALADAALVDARTERDDRAHVFVSRREVLVERQAALDHRRRAVRDHLEVGRADRDRVDAHQNFGAARHRHRLFAKRELARIAQHPCLHGFGNRELRAGLHTRRNHRALLTCGGRRGSSRS